MPPFDAETERFYISGICPLTIPMIFFGRMKGLADSGFIHELKIRTPKM